MAQVAKDLGSRGVMRFLTGAVDPDGSLLITDGYKGDNAIASLLRHAHDIGQR